MKPKKLSQAIKVGQVWVDKFTKGYYVISKSRSNGTILDLTNLKTGKKITVFKNSIRTTMRPATEAEQVLFGPKKG